MSADILKSMESSKIIIGKNTSDIEERIKAIKEMLLEHMILFFEEEGQHPVLDSFFQTAGDIMLSGDAKRLRCIIPVLIADQCNLSERDCMNYGIIVEMLHYTSLTHDDVIDQDMYRRGCKTLNNDFSNSQAVLLGDYILCMALLKCQKFSQNQLVIDLVVKMIKNLITGVIIEQREIVKEPTIKQYREMAELKTGSLFSLSFGLPFVGDSKVEDAIACGASFGTIFQIYDDFVDRVDDDPSINSFSMFALDEIISLWDETMTEFTVNTKKLGLERPVAILMNHLRKLGYFREEETAAGVLFRIPSF